MLESLFKYLTGGNVTPRAKNDLEIAGIIIAMFVALGGLYAYGSSREAKIEVLKSRVDKIDIELTEINRKLDILIQRGNK